MELQFVENDDVMRDTGVWHDAYRPVHKKIAAVLEQNPGKWAKFPLVKLGYSIDTDAEFTVACRKARSVIFHPKGPYQQSLVRNGGKMVTRMDRRHRVLYVRHLKEEE